MIDDWEITHERADLTPETWDFLKKKKFFGMIIPKEYGGLGFSALAHSAVLQKMAGMSTTLVSTVAVPNSLGPGELLVHYGTQEQKDHYLPRLADGREVPCFALTGPYAGSDATSIPDYGIVCKGEWNGANVVGVRLTFDKRYITLAPVATIVGLAFRMYDPDRMLGDVEDLGITLALLPRDTKGLEIGRRHFPLNVPFQNGPIRGKDVFVPLVAADRRPGHGRAGLAHAGRMPFGRPRDLAAVEHRGRRALGRRTRPARTRASASSSACRSAASKASRKRSRASAATRTRSTALSRATAAAVDRGEKPAVPSAIAKYHTTEYAREIAKDAMDVHGGKGVILGPSNWIGRGWQGAPIAITVEGANIMTRSLMIFGQGAIRCHPYVLREMQAARIADYRERLSRFDLGAVRPHRFRDFERGAQLRARPRVRPHRPRAGRCLYAPLLPQVEPLRRGARAGRRHLDAACSAASSSSRKSCRRGSATCFRTSTSRARCSSATRITIARSTDQPLLAWAFHDCVWRMQMALDGVLRNFPVRPVAWLLRLLVFPFGRREVPPSDRLGRRVAAILTAPNEARDRLTAGIYKTPNPNNPVGRMNALLPEVIAAEPVERKFLKASKSGELKGYDYAAQLADAEAKGVLSAAECALLEARARCDVRVHLGR